MAQGTHSKKILSCANGSSYPFKKKIVSRSNSSSYPFKKIVSHSNDLSHPFKKFREPFDQLQLTSQKQKIIRCPFEWLKLSVKNIVSHSS